MIIKKKTIGTGKPLLCVPVTDETTSGIVESINRLSKRRVDAIEWRADYYRRADSIQMVTTILQEVSGLLQDTVLLFTYRTQAEGGRGVSDPDFYESLLLNAASTGVPDFVDLEFAMSMELPMLLGTLRSKGCRVIASYHNFTETPAVSKMSRKFRDMHAAGADIAKIAVMPHDFADVCDLLKASGMVSTGPVIAIAMGQTGALSRLSGELCGSCLTFVTDGASSAPGQMSYDSVSRALDAVHACVAEGVRK